MVKSTKPSKHIVKRLVIIFLIILALVVLGITGFIFYLSTSINSYCGPKQAAYNLSDDELKSRFNTIRINGKQASDLTISKDSNQDCLDGSGVTLTAQYDVKFDTVTAAQSATIKSLMPATSEDVSEYSLATPTNQIVSVDSTVRVSKIGVYNIAYRLQTPIDCAIKTSCAYNEFSKQPTILNQAVNGITLISQY